MSNKNELPKKPAHIYTAESEPTKNEQVEDKADNESTETETPSISQDVYDKLPTLLKKGTDVFDQIRERDVFLTGALSTISSCLTNINGQYDGYEIYPNLNTLVIAPAASGKSRMKFAEALVRPIHSALLKEYEIEQKTFNAKKKIKSTSLPDIPVCKTLFIAGNNSSASVIRQLQANNGKGLIFETEADTLGKAFKQDWGTFFSEIVRASFQQESIRYQRSTDSVNIEIPKPKLSIALSGTSSQVQPLINSVQNGLFSRFIYYTYKANIKLKLISKDVNGINLTSHFEVLGKELCTFLQMREANEFEFEFTKEQSQKAMTIFSHIFLRDKHFLEKIYKV